MATSVRPRHLVLRNLAARAAGADPSASGGAQGDDDDDLPPLPDMGQMQLLSFYRPGLVAGNPYKITVSQQVTLPYGLGVKDLPVTSSSPTTLASQDFSVVMPQFSIESKDIHSTYPPQGHADEPRILPHVVFTDAHLPWERVIKTNDTDDLDQDPWLAVFPFDVNGPNRELQMPAALIGLDGTVTMSDSANKSYKMVPTSTYTFQMPVPQFLSLTSITNGTTTAKLHIPAYPSSLLSATDQQADVILVSGKVFKGLFALDTSGVADMSTFRFLAHARNINTQGMANAGVQDTGLFSVLCSKRTGPTDVVPNTAPRSQVCHVISLEYIAEMTQALATQNQTIADSDFVALVSLYSWTYLCTPPLTVSFFDAMVNLGEQVKEPDSCMLRSSSAILNQAKNDASTLQQQSIANSTDATLAKGAKVKSAVSNRLSNGYALVRHRLQTGEQTVAWNRGPLVPVMPAVPVATWPYASNKGQDFQLFDTQTGLFDITYGNAWQTGKLLAISDMGFVTALTRVRTSIHQAGVTAARYVKAMAQSSTLQPQASLLSNLGNSTKTVGEISSTSNISPGAGWQHAVLTSTTSDLVSTQGAEHKTAFLGGLKAQAKLMASVAGSNGDIISNEVNGLPASTDWQFVFNWIYDKLYLDGISTYNLIGDGSYLPPETIRFFHIDPNWFDAFIDGALSVANHMARSDDQVRAAIKDQLNAFFKTNIADSQGFSHPPQVPVWGFMIRSTVISAFPDLIVDIPWTTDDEAKYKAPILVQKHLGKDIMMVLLDREPQDGLIKYIKFSQPPHQQRFSLGHDLTTDTLKMSWRQVNAGDSTIATFMQPIEVTQPDVNGVSQNVPREDVFNQTSGMYDWTSTGRCVNLSKLESLLCGSSGVMGPYWNQVTSTGTTYLNMTSALLATQLNDPVYYLQIDPNATTIGTTDANLKRTYAIRTPASTASAPQTSGSANSGVSSGPVKAGGSNSSHQPISSPNLTPNALQPTYSTLQPPPQPSSNLPPNLNKVQKLLSGSASAKTPHFVYNVRPSGTSSTIDPTTGLPQTSASFVWTDCPYRQDIIFSIARAPMSANDSVKTLTEIQILLPVKVNTDFYNLGLVPQGADCGYRGRMLSNMRWVVHLDPIPNYMIVRLIPRSMRGSFPLTTNIELGFKLDGVDVSGAFKRTNRVPKTDAAQGYANIEYREIYAPNEGYASGTIQVQRRTGWTDPLAGLHSVWE